MDSASTSFSTPQTRTTADGAPQLPPVIILGGNDNALSLVRAFGKRGIAVHVVNKPDSDVAKSRYAKAIALPGGDQFEAAATEWLLGAESDSVQQSVLLAASDEALTIIANNHDALSKRFLLDKCNPTAQLQMLDKLSTYILAQESGVPTPGFWQISSQDDLSEYSDQFVFPLIVKPVLSHVFQQKFNRKFIVAENYQELEAGWRVAEDAGIQVMLVEKIPGPDSQLCSYYTWLDESGNTAFDFTKRIVRRYPVNEGLATCHITDHVEDVKEHAVRLLRHVGLQGLANAEFKLDKRDGQLKLIECNARFTAANGLVARAGIDLASLVYNRLADLPLPDLSEFQDGITMWDPFRDFKAFRELKRLGELSWAGWIRSIARRHYFPAADLSDPRPAVSRLWRRLSRKR